MSESKSWRRLLGVFVALVAIGFGVLALTIDRVPVPARPTDMSEMVHLDGGKFTVGGIWRETRGYWIDRFEVTEREWWSWRSARANRPIPPLNDDVADDPHRMVTWREAQAFAAAHFKRLPTNLEWERAAHGPGDSEMPWGSGILEDASNTAEAWPGAERPKADVVRVGTFEAGKSACGAYDMVGNVWEWTASDVADLLYNIPPSTDDADGFWHMTQVTNERFAIIRGGSFRTTLNLLALESRFVGGEKGLERFESVGSASWDLGFRCVIGDDEVALQTELWDLFGRLGYRDPLRILVFTSRAESQIRAIGARAVPYLRWAAKASAENVFRKRVERLIGEMDVTHE